MGVYHDYCWRPYKKGGGGGGWKHAAADFFPRTTGLLCKNRVERMIFLFDLHVMGPGGLLAVIEGVCM